MREGDGLHLSITRVLVSLSLPCSASQRDETLNPVPARTVRPMGGMISFLPNLGESTIIAFDN